MHDNNGILHCNSAGSHWVTQSNSLGYPLKIINGLAFVLSPL